ncbi:metallo-hydrolase/oxidoreductase, putative [Plasmodium sp. gorilla clade G2]|uniref:metallo-hydrolase/oxidoreductase, putative n=1 Tax=Plasmodium sp. gorilla clade G2 TaxID=880535 RepID=UPI000D223174|nr:metallo-hydrolase/oxidoreductase, putative [Plasmodium sp. gorilla clade G2]SOV13192.1 metallo-hydrolase/oxidoreductase, putative [Plasmodium sp. gorilla clade G2]
MIELFLTANKKKRKRKYVILFLYIVLCSVIQICMTYKIRRKNISHNLINYIDKNNLLSYNINRKKKRRKEYFINVTKRNLQKLWREKKKNFSLYHNNNNSGEYICIKNENKKMINTIKECVDNLLFINRYLVEEMLEDDKNKKYEDTNRENNNINVDVTTNNLLSKDNYFIDKKKKNIINSYIEEMDKFLETYDFNINKEEILNYEKYILNVILNNTVIINNNNVCQKNYMDKVIFNYINLILLNKAYRMEDTGGTTHHVENIDNKNNICDKDNNKNNYNNYNNDNSDSNYNKDVITSNVSNKTYNMQHICKKLVMIKKAVIYLMKKYNIKIDELYIDPTSHDIKIKRNIFEDNIEKKSDWKLIFLGTGSMYPSTSRGTSSFIFQTIKKKCNEAFLFDCGENTFIALQKANIKVSKIKNIFITHLHGDHCLGLISVLTMLRNMNTINIYGPEGLYRFLKNNFSCTYSKRIAKFCVYELKDGNITNVSNQKSVNNNNSSYNFNNSKNKRNLEYIYKNEQNYYPILKNDYIEITAFPIKHTIPTVGYIIKEINVENKFNANYIDSLIKKNYDELKKCENLDYVPYKIYENIIRKMNYNDVIIFPDQTKLTFYKAYKEIYKERKIVVCQDTYDASNLEEHAKDADVLIHESTNSLIDLTHDLQAGNGLYEDIPTMDMLSKNRNHNVQHLNKKGDIKDAGGDTKDAGGDTKDADGDIKDADGDIKDTGGDTKDTCGDIKDTGGDTKDDTHDDTKEDTHDNIQVNTCGDTQVHTCDEGNHCDIEKTHENTTYISHKSNFLFTKNTNNDELMKSYNKIISERGHSTANMAGDFARKINARKLILTHFSQRYIGDNKLKNILVMKKIEKEAMLSFLSGDPKEEINDKNDDINRDDYTNNSNNINNIYQNVDNTDLHNVNEKHGITINKHININKSNNQIVKNKKDKFSYDKEVIAAYDGLIVHIPPQRKQ